MAKQAVAVKKGGQVAVPDYGDDAGAGFEGTKASDLSIPFLAILQANSPQVEDDNPKGARAGMIYNTVTRKLINGEDGVVFLPAHKDHLFVEWVPRDSGGGFVGLHDPSSDEVKEAIARNDGKRVGRLTLANKNELIETHYVYGLILDDEGTMSDGFAVISFTSTKIKPCRDWFTSIYTIKGKPPIFASRAVIKTVKQKNDKGSFYNFQIDPMGEDWMDALIPPSEPLLQEGKDFRGMVTSGMAKAAFDTQDATGDASEGGGDGKAPF